MKKIRVGIIGCGKIFPMHAYSLKTIENLDLVAISDIKEDRLNYWSHKLEVNAYTNYLEMFAKEKLDVVHICTPHYLHKEMMSEAMQHDIHIISEKPATINLKDFESLIEEQESSGKQIAISFQNRYNPSSQTIKKILKNKELGNILAARAYLAWNRSDDYYGESDWKGTWDKEGGGVLIDQAIHTLDLMNWFIDKPVKDINISMGRRGHSKIDVEDYVEGTILYEDDVLTHVNFVNHYVIDAPIELEIVCEKGIIQLIKDVAYIKYDNGKTITIARNPSDSFNIEGSKQYWGVGHKAFIQDYYDKLTHEETIQKNSLLDVYSTHKLVFKMYEQGKANFNYK